MFLKNCINFDCNKVTAKAAKNIKKCFEADGQVKLEKVSVDFKLLNNWAKAASTLNDIDKQINQLNE
jgi:hypothetical protein